MFLLNEEGTLIFNITDFRLVAVANSSRCDGGGIWRCG